jgi:4-hydroxy-tetrahydrodipicolinate reductase
MTAPIRIALSGAAGRMGRMITTLAAADDRCMIVAATDRPGSPMLGQDIGTMNQLQVSGVVVSDDAAALFAAKPDVIIDFTTPAATLSLAAMAASHQVAMVIGTTGLSAEDGKQLSDLASDIPVVWCANTSVGVTLLGRLVEQVAAKLVDDWDIEIVESHHKHKIDAPSGTALALGQAAAKGRNVDLDAVMSLDRTGARQDGDIGFAVMRGGDVAGEHSVIFYGQSERLELTHRATDRVIFGRGALRAASWIAQQKAGLYAMDDVLAD